MSETGNGRKNWTRVVAAVGLVFLAVAGGIVLANANKVINKTEKKDEETPLISIGFSQVGAESEWRTGNSISIKTTFSQKRGYDLIFKDAQQQQEQQIKAIRGFIQQDVNYIVLAPVVETGWDTVLKEARMTACIRPGWGLIFIRKDRKPAAGWNNMRKEIKRKH